MSATCLHFMNSGDDQKQQPTTWPAIVRGSGIHPRIPMEGWAEEQPSAAGPPLGAHPPQQCRWCSTETTEVGWQEMEDWETHSSLPGKLWNCPRELATRWEVQLRNRATSEAHLDLPAWLDGNFSGFSSPQSQGLCTLLSTMGRTTIKPGRLSVRIQSLSIITNTWWCPSFPLKIPLQLDFGVEVSVGNCCNHPQFVPPANVNLSWFYDLCDWHSTPQPHAVYSASFHDTTKRAGRFRDLLTN